MTIALILASLLALAGGTANPPICYVNATVYTDVLNQPILDSDGNEQALLQWGFLTPDASSYIDGYDTDHGVFYESFPDTNDSDSESAILVPIVQETEFDQRVVGDATSTCSSVVDPI